MRTTRAMAALLVLPALAGCAEPPGELVLVVQTDMSIPKDIDTLRFEVSSAGVPRYASSHTGLGPTGILLPATLGLLPSEDDPSRPVSVRITARRGGERGEVRASRELTTTIPPGRVATLHMPLQFLCLGSAEAIGSEPGDVQSKCDPGYTCVAGSCVPDDVDSAGMPDYIPGGVFGGGTGQKDGTCLDVAGCFAEPALAAVDTVDCSVAAPAGATSFNVALVTETEGMCNSRGCFVALDADSDAGWRRDSSGRVHLPPAACSGAFGQARGIAIAPTSGECPRKTAAIPTCGPWSAVGSYEQPAQSPVAVAGGQDRPVSVYVVEGGDVYWASTGLYDPESGSFQGGGLKKAHRDGDVVTVSTIAPDARSPRQVVMHGGNIYWTEPGDGAASGSVRRVLITEQMAGASTALAENLRVPEGLSVAGNLMAWTEFAGGQVHIRTLDNTPVYTSQIGPKPYRVATNGSITCWTHEGTLGAADGSVVCFDGSTEVVVASGQTTPRAVAVDANGDVYWANFQGGEISMASRQQGGFGAAKVLAFQGKANPNGLAMDGANIYWTNRGDGTVWRLGKGSSTPVLLASGQNRPGEIRVTTEEEMYWVNEGPADARGGAVVQLKLEAP